MTDPGSSTPSGGADPGPFASRGGADPGSSARPVGDASPGPAPARLTAWVSGRVQGVGFRWWVCARGAELGLTGTATNLDDGTVEVIAEGDRQSCERLLSRLRGPVTPGRVTGVATRWTAPQGRLTGFTSR